MLPCSLCLLASARKCVTQSTSQKRKEEIEKNISESSKSDKFHTDNGLWWGCRWYCYDQRDCTAKSFDNNNILSNKILCFNEFSRIQVIEKFGKITTRDKHSDFCFCFVSLKFWFVWTVRHSAQVCGDIFVVVVV